MSYVILDLEFNGTYSKKLKKFVNEIIEFGAIKFDKNLNIIDKFSMVIKPCIGKKLNFRVKELTNISQDELSNGFGFEYALDKFRDFLGSGILITWGITDIQVLIQNYKYYNNSIRIPFIKKFMDLQLYCQEIIKYNETQQLGLTTATKLLNIDDIYIEHHRALDDSFLAFKCFEKIYNKKAVLNYIQNCDCDEFFERMNFKVSFIKNLNHPIIDKKELKFVCNECNNEAIRISEWQQKNSYHLAKFKCPDCGLEFTGKLQLKLTYNGLVVKKSIISNSKFTKIGDKHEI